MIVIFTTLLFLEIHTDFHAIPLPILLQSSVRDACIAQMLLQVSKLRYDLTQATLSDKGVVSDIGDERMNNPIELEALVHSFNERLSPEAAFIVCTGNFPPDYNEAEIVQCRPAFGTNREPENDVFKQKENGLKSPFKGKPDRYDCQLRYGSWEVTRDVVIID